MSAASVTSYDLEKASGGQLTHVPFIRCAAPFFTCVESPKSTSLSWPSRVKSKFSGLMSAWHSFCAWSSATAPASCWRSAAASFSARARRRQVVEELAAVDVLHHDVVVRRRLEVVLELRDRAVHPDAAQHAHLVADALLRLQLAHDHLHRHLLARLPVAREAHHAERAVAEHLAELVVVLHVARRRRLALGGGCCARAAAVRIDRGALPPPPVAGRRRRELGGAVCGGGVRLGVSATSARERRAEASRRAGEHRKADVRTSKKFARRAISSHLVASMSSPTPAASSAASADSELLDWLRQRGGSCASGVRVGKIWASEASSLAKSAGRR